MRDVIDRLVQALESGRAAVLCQIVDTRGSTPQKAGAAMLLLDDGGQIGTLGGGCVEAEVRRKAMRRFDVPGSEVHTYVLDHDDAWADGLVCGGRMTVIVEAFYGEAPLSYFRAFLAAMERGRGFTEAVALASHPSATGRRALFDENGCVLAGDVGPSVRPSPLAERPRSRIDQGFAWLPCPPTIRLVVVGAGHVGQAVATLAAEVDFEVWIVDDREPFVSPVRFPAAHRLLVGPVAATLDSLDVDAHTYFLIVTRGHGHDQEALAHAVPTTAGYIGMIGSRRKIRIIFEALREQGVPERSLDRVHAPVGLAIGSRTVPEIAVSIVAELIAHRNLGPGAKTS